jgi:hypothetical protein
MNIEIHQPELERRYQAFLRSGRFHDADELLTKAFDALEEHAPPPAATEQTGAVVLAALQARPYPDIDLTPPRLRLTNVRDVAL